MSQSVELERNAVNQKWRAKKWGSANKWPVSPLIYDWPTCVNGAISSSCQLPRCGGIFTFLTQRVGRSACFPFILAPSETKEAPDSRQIFAIVDRWMNERSWLVTGDQVDRVAAAALPVEQVLHRPRKVAQVGDGGPVARQLGKEPQYDHQR